MYWVPGNPYLHGKHANPNPNPEDTAYAPF